jgi:hypothetical protein
MLLNFNKKRTKELIKASQKANGMSKYRLDWLEDNKDSICGAIYEPWFSNKAVFIVTGYENEYKLICTKGEELTIYLIESIEEFLDFIDIEELMITNPSEMLKSLRAIKGLPPTGVAMIQKEKIFLYDFIGGKN